MWPYLLGHYKFGSTSRDRQETDRAAQNEFRSIMEEWKDVESVIQQQEKEHEVDGISMGSTGSRDEVYEQLEMIHNGLEKSEAFTHQRVSIEEPEIEGLDEAAKARLMNGQLIIPHQNGDDAESGCCSDCGEENLKITSSLRTCQKCSKSFDSVAELNGNATGHIPNGHGSRHNSEKDSDGDMDSPIYCKQCSRTSNGSKSSCPYSVSSILFCYFHNLKTESIRKLSNFNFQWTKTLYQNNLNNITLFFTFLKGYRCNRPLPSSKTPHFQNEAKCTTFLVKMSFICLRVKNDFHIKG